MLPLRTKNNLYQKKLFWQLKKWLNDKPVFLFWVGRFHGHYRMDNTKNYARILKSSLSPFLGAVIYSIFIIAVLELYNKYLPLKPIAASFDGDAIDSFLTAVASITGVFLGLYFTAISSIASNFLIRATPDVRNFFLLSPAGMQYVRTVAITGIVSVFYLFPKSLGHEIHPFGLVFLALLAAYVIIRFWSVGSSVFNSMEPGSSFPFAIKDITDSIEDVVPSGFQWDKPFLQNHRHRMVTSKLDLLEHLIDFDVAELKISEEQLLIALRYFEFLLLTYSEEKGKIPTNSFWYETKNKFESWAFADSTRIALALNTGTPIQPKSIKNIIWFEERNLDIAVKVLKIFVDKKDIVSIFQGCGSFISVAEIYGKDLNESGIKILFQKLGVVFSSVSLEKTKENEVAHKEQLAFIEVQGSLAISAVLGLAKYLDDQPCDKISKIISKINWDSHNKENIYLTGLPSTVLSTIEDVYNNLKSEKIIEGKMVSPRWYIKTLCIQQYLRSLQKYFEYLKSLHADYFRPKLERLLTEKQYSLAAHFLLRWMEFSNKYQNLVNRIESQTKSCEKFHWVKDLPFPVFNLVQEKSIALERDKEVTDKMIKLLPDLMALVTEDDLPDYFGQALTVGLEACYEACKKQELERLSNIFPLVFGASLKAYEKTRQQVQNWSQDDSKIVYSTEPLANLLEMSGFLILYSELYENVGLGNIARKAWDNYLKIVDAKAIIQFMVSAVKYRSSLLTIMPQAILRTNWQMDFIRKMKKEYDLPVFPEDRYDRKKKIDHPSPLIRVIAKWGGLMAFSAQEIFFIEYLSKHPSAEGIDFPDRHDIKEQIENESENNEEEYEDE